MPTRKKRHGPTAQTFETVERPKQAHFIPRNRTVTPKNLSLLTPRTRQQTLTQIDFVSRYPSDHEDDDLDYCEDEASRARKRRKTVAEVQPVNNVERMATRASAKRLEPSSEDLEEMRPTQLDQDPPQSSSSLVVTAPVSLPPPRTPEGIRKMEIPSSQSPADTPLSIRSRASARSISRSPLKQRSTNLLMQRPLPPDTKKGIGVAPKLEVEDTYECESSRSTRSPSARQQSTGEYVAGGASFLRLMDHAELYEGNMQEKDAGDPMNMEIPDTETTDMADSSAAERVSIKSEVADSSDEGDDVGDEDDFNVGNDTQAALGAFGELSSQTRNETQQLSAKREEHKEVSFGRDESAVGIVGSRHDDANSRNAQQQPEKPTSGSENSARITSSPHFHHTPVPRSQGTTTPNISPAKDPPFPRTESEEASDQLSNDLVRLTQPHLVLETESQFQSAWRDYSPPRNSHDSERDHSDQELPHIPSDPPSSDLPLQVRPSQATTVDVTQSSPHIARTQRSPLRLRTQARRLRSLRLPPEQVSSSSPPPRGVLSSSPLKDVELVWNGERLTDSQLLPDSLMNDSLPAPPPLTQESLGEGF
ncbi:MAG: hypothetical protein LQ347_002163 [Umbilicaria vellea]|nr:MAG: hypothetical protein LQ347_002163 [Umbilicaria vellea]